MFDNKHRLEWVFMALQVSDYLHRLVIGSRECGSVVTHVSRRFAFISPSSSDVF